MTLGDISMDENPRGFRAGSVPRTKAASAAESERSPRGPALTGDFQASGSLALPAPKGHVRGGGHSHCPARRPAARRLSSRRGITLLELMIVLMVVSLMVGITYPSVSAGIDSLKLRAEADRAAALLTQGITRVERTQAPLELLADRAAGRIVLRDFPGRFVREQKLESGVRIVEILPPLPASGEETSRIVLLAPGEPFPAVGLVFANSRGQRRLVRIDPLTAMAVVETPPDRVSQEETR